MNDSRGFTLLELLIALALFALLGTAGWRLLDSTVRVERVSASYIGEMRALQRAMSVIERDVLHTRTQGGQPLIVLDGSLLNVQRGNWLNPLDQPRSEWQEVSFSVQDGALWRHSRGDSSSVERQQLLPDAGTLGWRVVDRQGVWHSRWPAARGAPAAVELTLDSPRLGAIRRLFLLPGLHP